MHHSFRLPLPDLKSQQHQNIDLHINNCTALSVKILDNVPRCTPYPNFSLYPCAINYLKVYSLLFHQLLGFEVEQI